MNNSTGNFPEIARSILATSINPRPFQYFNCSGGLVTVGQTVSSPFDEINNMQLMKNLITFMLGGVALFFEVLVILLQKPNSRNSPSYNMMVTTIKI